MHVQVPCLASKRTGAHTRGSGTGFYCWSHVIVPRSYITQYPSGLSREGEREGERGSTEVHCLPRFLWQVPCKLALGHLLSFFFSPWASGLWVRVRVYPF